MRSSKDSGNTVLENFLSLTEAKTGNNRFIIGAFDHGMTLYKQQVRALNLLYALHSMERLKKQARIAVIGGGVSGLTATAAAIALGYEAYLFERRPLLLHLQHGCDTRWVHPNLYDWPDPGSDWPYAELPLLSWRESTASEVAEQIERGFKSLSASPQAGKSHVHVGATITFEEPLRVSWEDSLGDPESGAETFDAIIFAVGFGVERQVEKKLTQSYWRNDSLNQPEPGASIKEKARFLISGTGDGGLIDLLRARIQSFNQGRILRELIHPTEDKLISELQKIKKQWNDDARAKDNTWLFGKYNELYDRGTVSNLRQRLKARIRQDTEAILNGEAQSLSYALRLDKASLLNTLLVHNLKALNAFTYKPGPCKPYGKSGVKIKKVPFTHKKYKIVIRHGTDTDAVFRAARCAQDVNEIKLRLSRKKMDTSKRMWPAGWWEKNPSLGGERREFVPPATAAIATTFVSTLSDILKLLHKKTEDLQFRTTLHRLINVQGQDFFQQISRYAGTRTQGAVGRVFEVTGGLVGLVCRVGKPVIVRKDENFDKVWSYLKLKAVEAHNIDERVQTLLACPFFAPSTSTEKPTHISLVLFLDSAQENFFNRSVLENVYAACEGFVQNMESMKANREAAFSSSQYYGYQYLQPEEDLQFIEQYASVEAENEVFDSFIEDLTFKTVTSFDIDLDTLEGHESTNVI